VPVVGDGLPVGIYLEISSLSRLCGYAVVLLWRTLPPHSFSMLVGARGSCGRRTALGSRRAPLCREGKK